MRKFLMKLIKEMLRKFFMKKIFMRLFLRKFLIEIYEEQEILYIKNFKKKLVRKF